MTFEQFKKLHEEMDTIKKVVSVEMPKAKVTFTNIEASKIEFYVACKGTETNDKEIENLLVKTRFSQTFDEGDFNAPFLFRMGLVLELYQRE